MIGQEGALPFEKIEQIRHLLEIRGDIGVVAAQMHVVKLDMNDVLDPASKPAATARLRRCALIARGGVNGRPGESESNE
jgi:hypothetical protein